jgi:hypothetical protein
VDDFPRPFLPSVCKKHHERGKIRRKYNLKGKINTNGVKIKAQSFVKSKFGVPRQDRKKIFFFGGEGGMVFGPIYGPSNFRKTIVPPPYPKDRKPII